MLAVAGTSTGCTSFGRADVWHLLDSCSPLEQLDALAVGAKAEHDSRIQLRHLDWRLVQQAYAVLAESTQPCVEIVDLECDMVNGAGLTLTATVSNQLNRASAAWRNISCSLPSHSCSATQNPNTPW
jgi:hypothetical protein